MLSRKLFVTINLFFSDIKKVFNRNVQEIEKLLTKALGSYFLPQHVETKVY